MGTPLYMSPEQRDRGLFSESSDMYALGVILLELIFPPFRTEMERIKIITDFQNHRKVPEFAKGISKDDLFLKMELLLSNDPNKRPSSRELFASFQQSLYQEFIISDVNEYHKIVSSIFQNREKF